MNIEEAPTGEHGLLQTSSLADDAGIVLGRRNFACLVELAIQMEQGETAMDWNRFEGNWKQFSGRVKEKWGKLTDDDLDVINGRREQLEGKIQERYGIAKDQVRRDVDDWLKSMP